MTISAAMRAAIVNCGTEINEAVFDRLAARMSYVGGDFDDVETYQRVARHRPRRVSGVRSRDPPLLVRARAKGSA
jgi:glucose-6-phosphate 1-dehydrogenase